MTAKKRAAKNATRKRRGGPFVTAFRFYNSSTTDRVRLALPIGRDILSVGIDVLNDDTTPDDLCTRIDELLGEGFTDAALPEDDQGTNSRFDRSLFALHAAYAIGIAVGLQLRPDAFTKSATK